MSEEIATFHNDVMNKFLETIDVNNHGIVDGYLTNLYNLICEDLHAFQFETMNNSISCTEYLNRETFYDMTDILAHNECFSSIS